MKLTGTDGAGANVDRTTTTDADGAWSFTDLLSGTYTVTEVQPAEWNDGKDALGTTGGTAGNDADADIPLDAGVDGTGYLFGERGAPLSGKVFVDPDRDGKPGTGDKGLGGVTVTLKDGDGNVVATKTTDPDGGYQFTDLPAAKYSVAETQPDGYGSSSPDGIAASLPLSGLADQDFGDTLGTISGAVYVDANDNGVRDPDEAGIPGVTVKLTGTDVDGHSVSQTVTTGPDGSWTFTDVLGGKYSVTETQPAEYVDGRDTAGPTGGTVGADKVTAITLPPGADAPGNLFGELPTADLVLAKTHTGVARAGSTLDYTLAVVNHGPSVSAGPITITDTLPDGETYAAASGDGWGCSAAGRTVTCVRAEPLPVGGTTTVTLTVGLANDAPLTVANRATVGGPTSDVNPANNTSTDPLSILARELAVLPPDVQGIVVERVPAPILPVTGAQVARETRAGILLLELGALLLLAARDLARRLRRTSG